VDYLALGVESEGLQHYQTPSCPNPERSLQ